jgi:Tfp pilus assembly protein PilV
MDRKAITLMEIVVALVILSLTMAGLLNVFIAAKSHGLRSRTLISASELGKYFLDPLQMQVRQDQWGSNCLSTGSNCPGAQTITNYGSTLTYTPTYTITNVVGTGQVGNCTETGPATDCLRRVKISISWPTR